MSKQEFFVDPKQVLKGIEEANPLEVVVIGRLDDDQGIYLGGSHGAARIAKLIDDARKEWNL